MKQEIKIKKAKQSNLKLLNKYLAVKSVPKFHEDKYQQQKTGDNIWLIAWEGEIPVGHIQLRFNGSTSKEVQDKIKNCAHIESLGVAAKFRRRNIASKLIKFSEKLAKEKGFKKVGLSVETDNEFLKNLYMRRGYRDWKKGAVIESWEERGKQINEKCVYLIKNL